MEAKKAFYLLSNSILLGDNEIQSNLYVNNDNGEIKYITTDAKGGNHNYFKATKNPEHLSEDERYRILHYCLSSFDKDEIVNYYDLFLQNEFIVESNIPSNYTLNELENETNETFGKNE